jgi:hexosaminidase
VTGAGAGRSAGTSFRDLIPKPVSASPARGGVFTLSTTSEILVPSRRGELVGLGTYLAERLGEATGSEPRVARATVRRPPGSIMLRTVRDPSLGAEGYELTITPDSITLAAHRPAGLFWGIQTLRQLVPPAAPWAIRAGTIRDRPRFGWRGLMLDVARHFFGVGDVKRLIDLAAFYKLNRLHLHLTDDQGWRIAIRGWPRLTTHGGSTAVGGDRGGYYTQEQYRDIVRHAASRYVVVVPEIDMPGHTNAALSSYPELTCDGVAPPLYTGIEVGFSSLCIGRPAVDRFVDDVVGELAALTPGPYLHVGGDEAKATEPVGYTAFLRRVERVVRSHGKRMIGWGESAAAGLGRTSIVQYWHGDLARRAAVRGADVIMSPATKAYLDMKYDSATALGLKWAGYTSVRDAYGWDPATQVNGVAEERVLGVEAPLWTETVRTMADVEFLLFPRLLGIAEIGWSPAAGRSWSEYRRRLGGHGVWLEALGVGYYRSSDVPWR